MIANNMSFADPPRESCMHRPVIALSASQFVDHASHGTFVRHSLTAAYSEAVHKAGGIPIILPFIADIVEDALNFVDGLVLTGGSDFDPKLFGDTEIHPQTYEITPARDQAELLLARSAIERDIPLLGICRGIQAINIAFGGTLYQDVPTQYSSEIGHRQHEHGIEQHLPGHGVVAVPGSRLAATYGEAQILVNSFHHQAVKQVAPGWTVSGRSEDGLIEAIERPGALFALGVQWHPELMFASDNRHLRPFAALVDAAKVRGMVGSIAD
jgi:putative glutamine amidotransferase